MFYIYLYRDPKDGTPIYVGKGKGKRAWDHTIRSANPRLKSTLRKRKTEGYAVEPTIHNEADEATAFQMEMFWINFYGRDDLGKGTLFNLSDGGEGSSGKVMSAESRAKCSAANKGKPSPFKGTTRTPEICEKMSASLKGRTVWNKGKPRTVEEKRNIAKSKAKAFVECPNGEVLSAPDAARLYGFSANGIRYRASASSNGFKWIQRHSVLPP